MVKKTGGIRRAGERTGTSASGGGEFVGPVRPADDPEFFRKTGRTVPKAETEAIKKRLVSVGGVSAIAPAPKPKISPSVQFEPKTPEQQKIAERITDIEKVEQEKAKGVVEREVEKIRRGEISAFTFAGVTAEGKAKRVTIRPDDLTIQQPEQTFKESVGIIETRKPGEFGGLEVQPTKDIGLMQRGRTLLFPVFERPTRILRETTGAGFEFFERQGITPEFIGELGALSQQRIRKSAGIVIPKKLETEVKEFEAGFLTGQIEPLRDQPERELALLGTGVVVGGGVRAARSIAKGIRGGAKAVKAAEVGAGVGFTGVLASDVIETAIRTPEPREFGRELGKTALDVEAFGVGFAISPRVTEPIARVAEPQVARTKEGFRRLKEQSRLSENLLGADKDLGILGRPPATDKQVLQALTEAKRRDFFGGLEIQKASRQALAKTEAQRRIELAKEEQFGFIRKEEQARLDKSISKAFGELEVKPVKQSKLGLETFQEGQRIERAVQSRFKFEELEAEAGLRKAFGELDVKPVKQSKLGLETFKRERRMKGAVEEQLGFEKQARETGIEKSLGIEPVTFEMQDLSALAKLKTEPKPKTPKQPKVKLFKTTPEQEMALKRFEQKEIQVGKGQTQIVLLEKPKQVKRQELKFDFKEPQRPSAVSVGVQKPLETDMSKIFTRRRQPLLFEEFVEIPQFAQLKPQKQVLGTKQQQLQLQPQRQTQKQLLKESQLTKTKQLQFQPQRFRALVGFDSRQLVGQRQGITQRQLERQRFGEQQFQPQFQAFAQDQLFAQPQRQKFLQEFKEGQTFVISQRFKTPRKSRAIIGLKTPDLSFEQPRTSLTVKRKFVRTPSFAGVILPSEFGIKVPKQSKMLEETGLVARPFTGKVEFGSLMGEVTRKKTKKRKKK